MLAARPRFAVPPATAFEYSNLGFAVIGRVVERHTGERLQDLVDELLLQPLGLQRTTWLRPRHDDWARPYRVEDDAAVPDDAPLGDGALAPMGGLWSTVEDLARVMAFFDDAFPARDGGDDGPLRRSSRREQQQVQRAAGVARTEATGEGLDHVPGAHRRGWLRVRDADRPRPALRRHRRPLRRAPGLRLQHALAARPPGRRGGAWPMRPTPRCGCSLDGCSRCSTTTASCRPSRTAPNEALQTAAERRSSGSSTTGTTVSPIGSSPTTSPRMSPTNGGRGAACDVVAAHGPLTLEQHRCHARHRRDRHRPSRRRPRGEALVRAFATPRGSYPGVHDHRRVTAGVMGSSRRCHRADRPK